MQEFLGSNVPYFVAVGFAGLGMLMPTAETGITYVLIGWFVLGAKTGYGIKATRRPR